MLTKSIETPNTTISLRSSVPLMPTSSRQSQIDLETIIDQPLERRERTNHKYPDRQPIPEPLESNVAIDAGYSLSGAFTGFAVAVEFGYHYV
jgi:hypothetical protein